MIDQTAPAAALSTVIAAHPASTEPVPGNPPADDQRLRPKMLLAEDLYEDPHDILFGDDVGWPGLGEPCA